jgi:putative membrane protein
MAGWLVLFAAWWGPLPHLAMPSFAVHMIVHISIVAVAAPLIGAWLASSPLRLRLPRLLWSPITASVFEFIVVWSWHTPMLHELAQLSRATFVAEQASFVIAGVVLWTSALRRNGASAGAGVVALLLTSMHMILLGTLLTLAPRPLYTHDISSLGDLYAGLAGQRLGGMVMLIGGGLPYLAGGLYLVHRLLREPPIADTGGGPTPAGDVR